MKQYGRYDITLPIPGSDELEKHVFEPDEMTLGECLAVEVELGGETNFEDWIDQIDQRKAVAVQVLIWFLRRKAGVQQERFSVDIAIRKLTIDKIAPAGVAASPEASAGSEPATESPSSSDSASD